MLTISPAQISRYRRAVIRPHRVRTARAALRFIDALGFCYAFTSGPGQLPGLFDVLATSSIDRMWSWAWQWKEELATARRVHYGKVIRRKPSYISLTMLPAFYALSGNVGEPDDYLQAYREGRLSLLAKTVYEFILAQGPVSTWTLRRQFVPRGESGTRFHRALDDLQERFLVAKVAEEEEWRNGFIWDAFHRWMPEVVKAAGRLASEEAAAQVLLRYVRIVGVAEASDVEATFGWNPRLVTRAITQCRLTQALVDGRQRWTIRRLWK
ncbi:MAG: winged helix DNA-binding domain-containing protein [Armatimonadetes bacterium]|nr:winged helix DNA-binding domain-containing protein [Armatimonadota bacterium]